MPPVASHPFQFLPKPRCESNGLAEGALDDIRFWSRREPTCSIRPYRRCLYLDQGCPSRRSSPLPRQHRGICHVASWRPESREHLGDLTIQDTKSSETAVLGRDFRAAGFRHPCCPSEVLYESPVPHSAKYCLSNIICARAQTKSPLGRIEELANGWMQLASPRGACGQISPVSGPQGRKKLTGRFLGVGGARSFSRNSSRSLRSSLSRRAERRASFLRWSSRA